MVQFQFLYYAPFVQYTCHVSVGWLVLEVAIHLLSISSILCQLLTLYAVHHDLTCTLSVLVKGLRFQGVIAVLEISAAV